MSELKRRVITALVGVPLILFLVLKAGRFGAAILALVLSFGMLAEFCGMVFELPDRNEKRWFLLGLVWLVSLANFVLPREEYPLLLVVFGTVFGYFLFTAGRHAGAALVEHFRELLAAVFGLVYLLFIPFFLVLIESEPRGPQWVVLFLFIVWSSDTGGYFAGKRFGRRKLYPSISPKKTIEGALGGIAASLLVAIVYKLTVLKSFAWFGVFSVPILVASFAQIGDLCESFLKRAFDRKDSGSLLPGHGGFLDRFDGVLFSLPVMYGCVRIFS